MPQLVTPPEAGIYQAYGTWFVRSSHRFVRRLKRHYAPSVHGHRTWESTFVLIDYLNTHRPARRAAVVEAGCGWGPASVFCANRFRARVTAVDRDPNVFPYVEMLATLNGVKVTTAQATFARMGAAQLDGANLLIGSDICFWDNLVAPLAALVRRALDGGVARVVFADPGRAPFFELAERLGRRLDAELLNWYAVEPKRFEGSLLVVRAR